VKSNDKSNLRCSKEREKKEKKEKYKLNILFFEVRILKDAN